MDFLSKFEYPSTVIPDAVVTFRRVTATSRAAFIQEQAKLAARVREIARQREPLTKEYRAILKTLGAAMKAEVDALLIAGEKVTAEEAEARVRAGVEVADDTITRSEAEGRVRAQERIMEAYASFRDEHPDWADLTDQHEQMERDGIGWARLRQMVVSAEGLSDEAGEIRTADAIIERCPPEITDELIAIAEQIAGLRPTERGESPWPGTSRKAEGGPKNDTPAIPVEPEPEAA